MTNRIKQITDLFVEKKDAQLKQYFKDIKNKKRVNSISLDDLEKQQKAALKIKTGTLIDEIIGGGVPEEEDMMLYGAFGSGKTQICITTAILCPNAVIYIDAEHSLNMDRVEKICIARDLDYAAVKKKIIYFKPENWGEQLSLIYSLPSPMDVQSERGMKVDLIICDSVSKLFRGVEFLGLENTKAKNGLMRDFVLQLQRIAKLHKAAVIWTTQIYDRFMSIGSPEQKQAPVGGRSVEHQPAIVLHLRRGTGNIRVARMVDSSFNRLAERSFVLNDKGIDVLPEDASKAQTEINRSEKFRKTQSQEERRTRKSKDENEETEDEE